MRQTKMKRKIPFFFEVRLEGKQRTTIMYSVLFFVRFYLQFQEG